MPEADSPRLDEDEACVLLTEGAPSAAPAGDAPRGSGAGKVFMPEKYGCSRLSTAFALDEDAPLLIEEYESFILLSVCFSNAPSSDDSFMEFDNLLWCGGLVGELIGFAGGAGILFNSAGFKAKADVTALEEDEEVINGPASALFKKSAGVSTNTDVPVLEEDEQLATESAGVTPDRVVLSEQLTIRGSADLIRQFS